LKPSGADVSSISSISSLAAQQPQKYKPTHMTKLPPWDHSGGGGDGA
jgi:hypothetical protein